MKRYIVFVDNVIRGRSFSRCRIETTRKEIFASCFADAYAKAEIFGTVSMIWPA